MIIMMIIVINIWANENHDHYHEIDLINENEDLYHDHTHANDDQMQGDASKPGSRD